MERGQPESYLRRWYAPVQLDTSAELWCWTLQARRPEASGFDFAPAAPALMVHAWEYLALAKLQVRKHHTHFYEGPHGLNLMVSIPRRVYIRSRFLITLGGHDGLAGVVSWGPHVRTARLHSKDFIK